MVPKQLEYSKKSSNQQLVFDLTSHPKSIGFAKSPNPVAVFMGCDALGTQSRPPCAEVPRTDPPNALDKRLIAWVLQELSHNFTSVNTSESHKNPMRGFLSEEAVVDVPSNDLSDKPPRNPLLHQQIF